MAVATRGRSADKAPGFLGRHRNVYVYVPNLIGERWAESRRRWRLQAPLITSHEPARPPAPPPSPGYARIAFSLYAFAVALDNPTHCFLAYFLR